MLIKKIVWQIYVQRTPSHDFYPLCCVFNPAYGGAIIHTLLKVMEHGPCCIKIEREEQTEWQPDLSTEDGKIGPEEESGPYSSNGG